MGSQQRLNARSHPIVTAPSKGFRFRSAARWQVELFSTPLSFSRFAIRRVCDDAPPLPGTRIKLPTLNPRKYHGNERQKRRSVHDRRTEGGTSLAARAAG